MFVDAVSALARVRGVDRSVGCADWLVRMSEEAGGAVRGVEVVL
jgi:hypothetical protein